jgi:hypothetical protein
MKMLATLRANLLVKRQLSLKIAALIPTLGLARSHGARLSIASQE